MQSAAAKQADYERLAAELSALVAGESDLTANAANPAALIFYGLPGLNWAGFYWRKADQLILGPFQGRPACVRIALGRGVCGTAAAKQRTLVVPDVHEFPGHIACDTASQSEIVVPVMAGGALLGVLDLDSPRKARFDDQDTHGLERLVAILMAAPNTPGRE
jgi:L-methionine (R)-S-oxide reductase